MNTTFKFCPHCGGKQPLLTSLTPFECVYCGFTFYQNAASAVAGIIHVGDKILFTKRAKSPGKGKLDLPGGFVDHQETLEAALTREVKEELGIHLASWHYLCSGVNEYLYKDVLYHTCDAVYVCSLSQMPNLFKDKEEISDVLWLDKQHIPFEDIAFGSLRQALMTFIS